MPRKTKLTPELQAEAVKLAEHGGTDRMVCGQVGIDPDTLYAWLAKAREGKQPYLGFSEALTRARTRCDHFDLRTISEAARGRIIEHPDGRKERIPGDWRAAAWRLGRRHREDFGPPAPTAPPPPPPPPDDEATRAHILAVFGAPEGE